MGVRKQIKTKIVAIRENKRRKGSEKNTMNGARDTHRYRHKRSWEKAAETFKTQ